MRRVPARPDIRVPLKEQLGKIRVEGNLKLVRPAHLLLRPQTDLGSAGPASALAKIFVFFTPAQDDWCRIMERDGLAEFTGLVDGNVPLLRTLEDIWNLIS